MTQNETRLACSIVRNLISYRLKEKDAPCSSETHFNGVLYGLSQLIPDFNLEGFLIGCDEEAKNEIREMFSLAKEEIESYNPLR